MLEFKEVTYTLKKSSKPLESQLITSIGFSTFFESVSARVALESEREQGVVICVWF